MNWLSSIGETMKTFRVIWADIVLLIKDLLRRGKIENDIRTNSSAVDGLRKPKATDSGPENPA